MKIRIAIIFIFFLYFFPLFLSPVVANGGEKPLVIAGDVNFPPVEYLVKNEPKGLNVELWQELSKAMNRKVDIQLMQWADAQKKVLNGEADALTLLGPTEKRRKLYDFSDTTLTFKFTLFVRNNDMTVSSISDLDGKTVGVTKGGYPRQVLESKKQIKLFFIKNNLEGFRRLETHEINAVAAEAWVGAFAIQENGIKGIRMVEKPFATTQASIAVKKGNQKLLNEINLGINKLKKDGR